MTTTTDSQSASTTTVAPEPVIKGAATWQDQPHTSTDNMNTSLINSPDVTTDADGRTTVKLNASNGQKAVLTPPPDTCLANYSLCDQGLTIVSEVKFLSLSENTRFMSKGGELEAENLVLRYKYGALTAQITVETRAWYASSTKVLKVNVWYRLEISWSRATGLQFYINGDLEGASNDAVQTQPSQPTSAPSGEVTIAPEPAAGTNEKPAEMLVADTALYNATRDTLIKQQILPTG